MSSGWWIAGVLVLTALAGLILWRRRSPSADPTRRQPRGAAAASPSVPPAPPRPPAPRAPMPQPQSRPDPRPAPNTTPAPALPVDPAIHADRARIALALSPRRAGFNLLSATVEAELVVRNDGAVTATAVRIGATLIEAGQQDAVAAVFGQPIARPITPPFMLAPGDERRVRVVVALPRADIRGMQANGRAMFVPVVAITALYDAGGVGAQSGRAFAIGIERADAPRLAPFWLDQPARMHDDLGIRPYAAALDR